MCNHLSQACYVVSTCATTYLKHKLPVGGILPFLPQMASTWKQLHVMRQNPAWNKVVTTLYTVCLTLYLSRVWPFDKITCVKCSPVCMYDHSLGRDNQLTPATCVVHNIAIGSTHLHVWIHILE